MLVKCIFTQLICAVLLTPLPAFARQEATSAAQQVDNAPADQQSTNPPPGRQSVNAQAGGRERGTGEQRTEGARNNLPSDGSARLAGQGADAPTGTRENNSPLPLFQVACVSIFDDKVKEWEGISKMFESAALPTDTERAAQKTYKRVLEAAQAAAKTGHGDCPVTDTNVLVGTGDIVLGLASNDYATLDGVQIKRGARATLYLNGVNLDTDAELVSVERFANITLLRYNIIPGDRSKRLWATLYREGEGATIDGRPLNAGLGFISGPITFGTTNPAKLVAITHERSLWWAGAVITLLMILAYFLGRHTGIFRDATTPAVFERARLVYRSIKTLKKRDELLKDLYPCYLPENDNDYRALAEKALAGEDMRTSDQDKLAVGLVLTGDQWERTAPSYSLGRVQLGMWFLFAVATGGFLWVIYGELPVLDGSLLALLGLSMGVTGISLAVDKDNPEVRFRPSRGIFHDLITDWQDQHQVYRFQAVVVNILLLMVGIYHVVQHLTYPIFDPTWLAFLGISGAALTAGKSIVEGQHTVKAPPK